ncbi:TLC domain-containing protein 2-like [Crassostrea virginica]
MAHGDDNMNELLSQSHDVDQRMAVLMIVCSVSFFGLLNISLSKAITPPKSATHDPWRWRNLCVSWIHAILCGCWDLVCFIVYPEMLDDLVAHINYFTYMLVAFSTGYFLYDAFDMYINNRLLHDWGVTVHHFIVVIFFLHNILMKYAIGFSCVALLAEVNGIFLHARKLMQIFQFGFDHKLYVINKYTNLMTFVACRMFPIGRIFYGVAYECQALTPPVVRTFLCLLTIMAVINMVLLWRICKSDVLSTSRRKIG